MSFNEFIHALRALCEDWEDSGKYNHHLDPATFVNEFVRLFRKWEATDDPD